MLATVRVLAVQQSPVATPERPRCQFELKSGRLMDAERVRSTVFDLAREDRDALLSWSTQNAPLMAAEMGVDQVKFAVMHEKYVAQYLAERSERPLQPTLQGPMRSRVVTTSEITADDVQVYRLHSEKISRSSPKILV